MSFNNNNNNNNTNLISSFFNVAEGKKPKKNIEESYNETSMKIRVYKKKCERMIIVAQNNLKTARLELDKYIKENNREMQLISLKQVKVYEANITKMNKNMKSADFIMIDLQNAQNAKLMGDLQANAAAVYKDINSQISVEQVRNTNRNLEMQREKFKEKNETINEINDSMLDSMLLESNDNDDDGDDLNDELESYIELKLASEELEVKAKLAAASSSSSSSSKTKQEERIPDYLDNVLEKLNI
jgi:hypothetical protein